MGTQIRAIQRDRRYQVLRPEKAFIEFSHGRRDWRVDLNDVSVAGLSFSTDGDIPGVDAGARLESVELHVGDCHIRGAVIVRHVTAYDDGTTHFGGVFYPAEEDDLLKLNGVLGGIDTIEGD